MGESSYTVVDVKFETGQNPAMDAVANHLEDSNSFQQQHQEFGEEDEEEALQTPNSSPRPQEAVNNKRKRSIPKKFSVDEDENPLHKADKGALTTIFSSENGNIVKTEVDYSSHSYDDIAAPDQEEQSSFKMVESWDDEAAANAEGEDHGLVLQQQIAKERELATKANSAPRDDCPICGDKANGLHYGVYACEGCKNFFKRSVVMTQKKPYICNNQHNCDVRIVIDMSGIKRKGARCQACRYTACLDAGMYHSGYPRSRGGRHNSRGRIGSNQADWNDMIGHHQQQQQLALESPMTQNKKPRIVVPPRKPSVKEAHEASTEFLEYDKNSSWDKTPNSNDFQDFSNIETSNSRDILPNNISTTSEELLNNSHTLFDTVFKDDIEKERSKNRDLTSRLVEKDKQLKLAERQVENMRRHMMISQTVASQQQEEIKRLKNEINRLSFFKGTVRNYQNASGMVNGTSDPEADGVMIDPDMLSVSFNE